MVRTIVSWFSVRPLRQLGGLLVFLSVGLLVFFTLLDIIEAVEGPVSILDCVLDPGLCERSDYCECLGIWRDVNQSIVRVLESHSLADLIGRTWPVSRSGDLCVIRTGPKEDTHGRPSSHAGR